MTAELAGIFVLLALAGAGMWWLMSEPSPRGPLRLRTADPWFEAARTEARRTVPEFRRLLAEHPGRGMVKQRVNRPDGIYRGRWADVREVSERGVEGVLRGPNRPVDIAWNEIEDWQITLPDGTFAGAYTVMAAWKVRERHFGGMPVDGVRDLARFRDWPTFGNTKVNAQNEQRSA